jgi:hypothetical protein
MRRERALPTVADVRRDVAERLLALHRHGAHPRAP